MTTFTISLPTQIAQRVDTVTKREGYATRSEFIRSLLRRYFAGEIPLEPFTPRPLTEIQDEMTKTGKYNKRFIRSVIAGLSRSSLYAHKPS